MTHEPRAIKPFADKRVRQAINYAIDTDLIIKRLVKDKAYRAVSWLPLCSPAFDKSVKPYAFDPDKAKKLLAEAGYPDGFEFELTTSQNESWGLPIVEAIIPMLAKVGIKVKPKLVEVTVLTDIAMKGELPGLYRLEPDRPRFARHLALLLLQDAAHGLQLHRLQQSRVRQAARRGRPATTRPSATTCCARPTTCSTTKRRCGSSTTTRRCWPISRGSTACRPTRPRSRTSTARTSGSTRARRRSDGGCTSLAKPAPTHSGESEHHAFAAASGRDPMLLVLARRLGNVVPTLLAVVALVFLLFSVLPGSFISGMNEDGRSPIDPAVMERMRKEMGLDDPLPRALRQVRRQRRHRRSRHLVPHARAGDQADRPAHLAVAQAGLRRHGLRHLGRRDPGVPRRAAARQPDRHGVDGRRRSRASRCRSSGSA